VRKSIFVARQGGLAYVKKQEDILFTNAEFPNFIPDAILVSNDFRSPSNEYRTRNISQALWENGVSNVILTNQQIAEMKFLPSKVKLVYFWRTALDLNEFSWYGAAKSNKVTIAFDSDDLTFETSTYSKNNVHALKNIGTKEADYLVNVVAKLQENQVKSSSLGIGGTPELCRAFARLGVASIELPIVLPRWMQFQGSQLYRNKRYDSAVKGLRIVYCSGSRSHDVDFLEAKEGVFDFLREFPQASLTLQGASPVAKHEIPIEIRKQVNFLPMMPHGDLLPFLSKFHVQIAPLEMGNSFVEAKSATKFMQGGIVGVVTIASPTEPFANVIEDGVNGFLAHNTKDWFEALVRLTAPKIREETSRNAFDTVISQFTVDRIKPICSEMMTFEDTGNDINIEKDEIVKSPLKRKVVWLLPTLMVGSGGHRNVFRLADLLGGPEFECKIFFHNDLRDESVLTSEIRRHYGYQNIVSTSDLDDVRQADIVVGVHNSSIPFLKRNVSRSAKQVYLVQDFEPWFSPMGKGYLDALATYFDKDLKIITSGRWMSSKMESLTGKKVPHFDFPLDKTIYYCDDTPRNQQQIAFFAKQDTPRRLFDVGIAVLEEVKRLLPDLQIKAFGSSDRFKLFGHHYEANLYPKITDLANLYRESSLGLVFSPTNPSLVPYEMMSCGLPIVDIDLPEAPMQKYGRNLFIKESEYSIEKLIARVVLLLSDQDYWNKASDASKNFSTKLPTPEEASKVVKEFFRKLL
jgi:glycosyltransferase involved in cell wall biosynthesis